MDTTPQDDHIESAHKLMLMIGKRIGGLTLVFLTLLILISLFSFYKLDQLYEHISDISTINIPLRNNIRTITRQQSNQLSALQTISKTIKQKETSKTNGRQNMMEQVNQLSHLDYDTLNNTMKLSSKAISEDTNTEKLIKTMEKDYYDINKQSKELVDVIMRDDFEAAKNLVKTSEKDLKKAFDPANRLLRRLESMTDKELALIHESEVASIHTSVFLTLLSIGAGIALSILITRQIMKRLLWNITQREKAEKNLKESADELVRSNKELEQFAHVTSHDLKAPLTPIIGYCEIILRTPSAQIGEEERGHIQRILKSAQRMNHMISDLLSYARISGMPKPHEPVNLEKIIRNILIDLELRIKESDGKVETGPMPIVLGDPLRLHQLFLNLVNNAIKFAKSGVPPLVTLNSHDLKNGFCEITVDDNGIGFNEKYLNKIFKPFERLHSSHAYEGSGIGLAICEKVVNLHGGTITAKSTPGKGSKFILTLPLSHDLNPASPSPHIFSKIK